MVTRRQSASPRSTSGGAVGSGFRYRPALDGIRCCAVLAVVAFHANTRLRGGGIGVDIFFVLSGFLITSLLLQEYDRFGSIAMRAFYGRRARRLLPALVVTIALVGLIYLLRPNISEGAGFGWTAIAALFYAANFSHLDLALFTPTWSLSLEEQFYILWPPLLVLCLRGHWNSRRIFGLVLLLAILIAGSRATLWLSIRDAFSLNWRADGLLLGCALAVARRAPSMRRHVDRLAGPSLVPLGAAALLVVYAFAPPPLSLELEGGLSLVAIAAGVVIVHATIAQPSPLNRLLSLPAAVWVGKRSYGIYLYHLPILVAFRTLPLPYWPSTIAAISVTLVVAALSYRFIESPFLRGKHYHTAAVASSPSKTAAVEPA